MKYTSDQLSAMASSCRWYKENQPDVHMQFLLTMSMHTGLHPYEVERRISEMEVEE